MFKFSSQIIALSFLAPLLTANAYAAEKLQVKANSRVGLGAHYIYNTKTCRLGALPKIKVTKAPLHGTLTTRKTTFTVNSSKHSRCNGTKGKGTEVIYTPKKGFRGKDRFTYEFTYQQYDGRTSYRAHSRSYNVSVK